MRTRATRVTELELVSLPRNDSRVRADDARVRWTRDRMAGMMPLVTVPRLDVCEPLNADADYRTMFTTTACFIRSLNTGREQWADYHVELGVNLAFSTYIPAQKDTDNDDSSPAQ